MTTPRFAILFLGLTLMTPMAALAQETAGRVLTSVGNVTVVRGAARIEAQRDTRLLSGDQIELGPTSNAQIHLTDQTVIALRSDTTFRLTDYVFQEQQGGQRRAFFDLIKGGMRTVSGAIGKFPRQQDYRVTTPTSTIGIRGTHYKLAHTPEGTYGGVTEGRISVTNRSGESVFGSDQYFRVIDQDSRAQQLIGPPAILNDRLEGGRRRAGTAAPGSSGQQGQTASAAKDDGTEAAPAVVAQTGTTGGTGDTRSSGAVATDPVSAISNTTLFQPNAAASVRGPAAIVQPTQNGTVFYRLQGPFSLALSNGRTLIAGDITLGVNLSLQLAGISVNVQSSNGSIANFGTPFGPSQTGMPITVNAGQLTFNSTFNRADFPQNQGSFRCSTCSASNGPGFFDSITFQGTISGSLANVNISVTDSTGISGVSGSLSQQAPPNNFVAAIVIPRSGGGADARSSAYWNVQLDSSRRLIDFGPTVGLRANVGTAANTIVGSAPSAGNLVWGSWSGAGANVTDFNYATFTTGSGRFLPWITGDATNTLPVSLGVQTYTPVGWTLGTGIFNSGSLTADFVNRNMTLSLNATNPGANNTFQMNGASSFSSINGRFSAGFSSVTCTGPCVGGVPNGGFGGFFAGQSAEGAGVGFTVGFGAGTGVNGVVGFKR